MLRRSTVTVFLLAAAAGLTAHPAHAQIPEGWEIVEIFPRGTEYDCGPPDINDRGQIVFHRRLWPQRRQIEIVLFDRGKLTQLTNDQSYDAFPSISNRGEIVWQRDLDADPNIESVGIVRLNVNGLIVVSDQPFFEGDADINDAGQIVWSVLSDSTANYATIHIFDGSETEIIGDDRFSNQSPRINQAGEFVFTQYDFRRSPWQSEIFAYFAIFLQGLTPRGGQPQLPDINDNSEVVWQHGAGTISHWVGGKTYELVSGNGYGAHINNRGDVSFSRWDATVNNSELWMIRDGTAIQLTNAVFGGGASAINRRGEIAFQNGRLPYTGISLFTRVEFVADLDLDGDVDLADAATLQRCFGVEAPVITEPCCSADTDGDGVVDHNDLTTLIGFLEGP